MLNQQHLFCRWGSLEGVIPKVWDKEDILKKGVPEKYVEDEIASHARHCPPPIKGLWAFIGHEIDIFMLPQTAWEEEGVGFIWEGPLWAPKWTKDEKIEKNPAQHQGCCWTRFNTPDEFLNSLMNIWDRDLSAVPNSNTLWPRDIFSYNLEVFLPLEEGKIIQVVEDIYMKYDFMSGVTKLVYKRR